MSVCRAVNMEGAPGQGDEPVGLPPGGPMRDPLRLIDRLTLRRIPARQE
jgi:hypothetical protein